MIKYKINYIEFIVFLLVYLNCKVKPLSITFRIYIVLKN